MIARARCTLLELALRWSSESAPLSTWTFRL